MPVETTYTNLRQRLASVLDQVANDHDVVIVRRRHAKDVALVPAEELTSLLETAHLLRSPRNAQRLMAALQRATRGKGKPGSVDKLRREMGLGPAHYRQAVFQDEFREDLRYWVKTDRKTALRILELVEAVIRNPFTGIGKLEPLKFVLAGCWSRRITQEHRLVYRVTADRIDFLQARYHY